MTRVVLKIVADVKDGQLDSSRVEHNEKGEKAATEKRRAPVVNFLDQWATSIEQDVMNILSR